LVWLTLVLVLVRLLFVADRSFSSHTLRRDLKEEKLQLTNRIRQLEDEQKLSVLAVDKLQKALELATYVNGGADQTSGSDVKSSRKPITGGKEVPSMPALIAEVANWKIKEENARKKADRLQDMLDRMKV
jgi:hypothetical protein